jgi:hypothetical protein
VGFNREFFSGCIQSISAADAVFSTHFEIQNRTQWMKETYLEYDAVTFSNRYFTNVVKRSYLTSVPFTKDEDPYGNLSAIPRTSGIAHCEENIVKYFSLQNNRYD